MKPTKTKQQIFKSKILEQVKELPNKGEHLKASKLFDEYFKLNFNYSKIFIFSNGKKTLNSQMAWGPMGEPMDRWIFLRKLGSAHVSLG